jgi:hypothetical protein
MLKQNKNNTIILMGDFNARLPSHILGDSQSNKFGNLLLHSVQENMLSIISPSTRTNPTPTCITKQGKSMIDHIICPMETKHLIKNCNIDPAALFANPSSLSSIPTSDHTFITFNLEKTSPTKPLNWGQSSLLFNWSPNKKSLYQITTKTLLKIWNDKWNSNIKSNSDIEIAEKELTSHLLKSLKASQIIHQKRSNSTTLTDLPNKTTNSTKQNWLTKFLDLAKTNKKVTDEIFWKLFKKMSISLRKSKLRNNPHPNIIHQTVNNKTKILHTTEQILNGAIKQWTDVDLNKDKEASKPIPKHLQILTKNKKRKRNKQTQWKDLLKHKETPNTILSRNPTINEIIQCIKSKPTDKAPGNDQLPYEAYKYAHESIYDCLLTLFTAVWTQSTTPSSWQKVTITLLAKAGKDKKKLESYRPISLTQSILKIYETLLNNRLKLHLSIKSSLPIWFGCTNGTSADEIVAYTNELIQTWKSQKKLVHALNFDLSKAFNRVQRNSLWNSLCNTNINANLFRAIFSTYEKPTFSIKIGNKTSKTFNLTNGIKQGSVLSTTLFMIHMLTLSKRFSNLLQQNPNSIQSFFYIDDILIVTSNLELLKKALEIIIQWAQSAKCIINFEKSQIITSAKKNSTTYKKLNITSLQTDMKLQQNLKYLGYHISLLTDTFNNHLHQRREKARAKIGALRTHFKMSGLNANLTLFKSIILTSVSFGSRIIFQNEKSIQHSNTFMHTELCKILQIPPYAEEAWVRWECTILDWLSLTTSDKLKFAYKLHHSNNLSFYKNKILNTNSYFLQNLTKSTFNLQTLFSNNNFEKSKTSWHKLIKETAKQNNLSNTKSDLLQPFHQVAIQNILPISNELNNEYVSNLTQKNLLQFTLSIRANTLFQLHFNCPYCTKLLSPQIATTHILFDCNIQSIVNIIQQKLTTLTSITLVQKWKNLNSNMKLLLLTGINNLPEENPLSNLNKSITIIEILSLIKEILTPIILLHQSSLQPQ